MTRRFITMAVLMSLVALASTGCPLSSGHSSIDGGDIVRDDGIDRFYKPYRGPLQAGRSYGTKEQNTFTEQGGDYDPAISPDGKWLLYASTYHSRVPEIYIKTTSGSTRTRLTNTPHAEIQPCFSPDGKNFAYATNCRGNWDICIQGVQGGRKPQWLTLSMQSDEISPSWHPGGQWIAFSTYNARQGCWEIAVKSLKTGQVRYLGEGLYPRFSPDGRKIAFQRARTRSPRWYSVWTMDVDEDFNVNNVTEVVSSSKWAAINANWSPDGRYLAFATVHESPLAQGTRRILMGDDIWVVNIEGQDLVRITNTGAPESHPVWARDAKGKDRIYFCSMEKGPKNIWSLQPLLPEPFGSVSGSLPGSPPARQPEKVSAEADQADESEPESINTFIVPPPPAVTAGGSVDQ